MHPPNRPAHDAPSIGQLAEFVPGALLRYRVRPDGTDRIEHMSGGCLDLWEITAADLADDTRALWGMVDPSDLPGFAASIAESARLLSDWSFQWRITTPSGRRKWLHGVGRPRAQSDGSVLWHSFILDVTHHQQTRESLSASEERFRQLIDAIPNVAVQGYDAQLVCRFWNQASERLYGYSAVEAVGSSLLDLIIPAPMRDAVVSATAQMMRSGEAIPAAELVLQRKGGRPVPVYSSHVLLRRDGHAPEFFCIDYDLTERQTAENTRLQLQSQLRESQKMEALGTLAGGVAHDFNNIVAAILGNVELALDDLPAAHPARTSLQEIRKAGRRARDLVQQILAFSRRQDSTREPTCLRAVLEDTHRLLQATLPTDLTLLVHADPNLPAVMANATQIAQVMLNLATNALQAAQGRPGASVQLRLERIERPEAAPGRDELQALALNGAWPGTGVCLKVIDNGTGMAPETLARAFEPFFTTKAPGSGTGLGLAVVHGILREHGAALRVSSQRGVGTVFTAIFPGLTDAAPDEPVAATPEPAPTGRPWGDAPAPHVVYVDDDEAMAFLVQRLLERDGYRVSAYTDAQAALDALRQGPLDVALCITDYNMPGMSGLGLAREIKALHPQLPVAIASGYISEELRLGAPSAGVDEVIFKPDTVEAMCAAIQRLLPH
ncbi:MAG: response regulator [Hydrogenophaga sp.]|uniref:hybrid sensor histidine kinase/response regulator n=1 Tax=Hydrogenophaga sp. TaxID=1904254 RepID=UPI0025BF6446|nr:PAS domain-containing sensor histidine kinase [Hydrogenophaga sp.]MBT9552174.1 response regulator [Hydrogenophaga sp.]